MKFLKRILVKSKFKNLPFTFNTDIISDPNLWNEDIIKTLDSLDSKENHILFNACSFIQEGIILHHKYIMQNNYTLEKLSKDPRYIFKSCFEITILHWILLTQYFKENNIKFEVGYSVCYVIEFSFSNIESLFVNSPFKTFENAFKVKSNTYLNLLNQYFNPRINEIGIYQDLFKTIIEIPMTAEMSEDEKLLYSIRSLTELDNLSYSLDFHNYLSNRIGNFLGNLDLIKV
ncbi:MAG: hypothetical protein H7263_03930 [Candidatus Sericytochromatia bacterium]|nr:hypothetical protein [Candidatus Sericytochromatia bacterium]